MQTQKRIDRPDSRIKQKKGYRITYKSWKKSQCAESYSKMGKKKYPINLHATPNMGIRKYEKMKEDGDK